jgi:hypothetical protein
MKKNHTLLLAFMLIAFSTKAQINDLLEKYTMDASVQETSGLIFHNDRLITHNDSGGTAQLFEMDTINSAITRTVTISNATNIDWEDIAQDTNYIYIGDFGNNEGTRTDLKIYRISKTEYDTSTTVAAEVINFSYNDQTSFTANSDTNFDCEAMLIKGDNILLFSKNWGDSQCNVYILPKTIGTHTAVNSSSYNTEGMITGASYNEITAQIFLTGYTETGYPFISYLDGYTGDAVFGGTVTKTNILTQGSQVEAITHVGDRYFISREHVYVAAYNITIYEKLYAFNSGYTASIAENEMDNTWVYPNPANQDFTVKLDKISSDSYVIYNQLGQEIIKDTFSQTDKIEAKIAQKGVYFVTINGHKTVKLIIN